MIYLICCCQVADLARWKRAFDSQATAHRIATLGLLHIWRTMDSADELFLVFEVGDIGRARDYLNSPEAADAERAACIVRSEHRFVESASLFTWGSLQALEPDRQTLQDATSPLSLWDRRQPQ